MFGIYVPKMLYELLPYVYVLLGVSAVFLPDTFGQLAGAVLTLISGRILGLRSAHRSFKS